MRLGAARATSPYARITSLAAVAIFSFATACRSDKPNNNGGTIKPPPPGGTTCPGEGLTVCDLKLESSSEHPAIGDPVVLENVVVTTPTMAVSKSMGVTTLAGFYVQDQVTSDTLDGQYSGILVTYFPDDLGAQAPVLFDVISVTGVFEEYGQASAEAQKQIEASAITNSGTKGTITPIDIERADLIASGGEKAEAYEGVVVKIAETTITSVDVQPNGMPIYGAFVLDQSLIVSDVMYEYRNPVVSEVFTSITGVLRLGTTPYESNQYLLTPRFEQDVVPKNQASVVRSIKAIQDPTAPGHPSEGCANLTGGETVGKCAQAELTNVVVTAIGGYVSSRLRSMWVQDDSVADGRYAGVKIVYNKDTLDLDTLFDVGMRVDVEGEIIEYRSGTQIQYPKVTRNGSMVTTVNPTLVTASEIARTTVAAASPWEGVLVKIENGTVTTRCLEDNLQRDHGNWIVDGQIYVGTAFQYRYAGGLRSGIECLTPEGEPTGMCSCASMSRPNDQRTEGDVFTSITGIPDFAFNEYQLQPRGDADLVLAE
ncbi:hypothetical protein L6R52_04750 [Myxococcota bacterium]|nr:hypothetical protein [Myxococcota bacterium]